MPHRREGAQRKRRSKAVPTLGAAGLSFSLAVSASAAIGDTDPHASASAPAAPQVTEEEQIFEASLAAFRVFDNENIGTPRRRVQPTMISQGACGIGFYYPQNPPAVSGPAYQAAPPSRPRLVRPPYKYRRP
jgi:hypothetical protein